MRNLHATIKQEYGQGGIFLLRQWEKLEKKMANFKNHWRFTMKCLKNNIVPVSVRLKTNINTTKGLETIRRAEKQLLNEHVRIINNQPEIFMLKKDTCIDKLKNIIKDQTILLQCEVLMNNVVESRHTRVLERQRAKYEALHQQKLGGRSYQGLHYKQDTQLQTGQKQPTTHDTIPKAGLPIPGTTEETKKWVINLSDQPLTEEQEKILAYRPKFVIKPKRPPVEDYITAIEKACPKLEQGPAEELRVEVKKILKRAQNNNRSPSNITKEELKALNELKKDQERIILTTDKGVALVVMNKTDYINKSEELLNTSTYKRIPEDSTNRQKARLINILKKIKSEGGLSEEGYKKMYPTGAVSPKYYGLPKIHKVGTPLMHIISSIGTATYNTAKELARVLKPLVGTSNHHVQNTRDFIDQMKDVRLKDGGEHHVI